MREFIVYYKYEGRSFDEIFEIIIQMMAKIVEARQAGKKILDLGALQVVVDVFDLDSIIRNQDDLNMCFIGISYKHRSEQCSRQSRSGERDT